jgi:raffinose/stachyose/melibiose transport system substrate-binding protein
MREQRGHGGMTGTPMSRRTLLKGMGLGGLALAMPGLLAACGSSSADPSIVFDLNKQEEETYFQALVGKYNKETGSHVVYSNLANELEDFVRGTPPDVDLNNYEITQAEYVTRGVLADLSDLPLIKTIEPSMLNLVNQYGTVGSQICVLPFSVGAAGMLYNPQLFDKVGAEVPKTWTEMINVCELFKSKNIIPIYQTYATSWTVAQGIWDYCIGGLVDTADFFRQLNLQGSHVGPDSEVSFQKTLAPACAKMVELSKYSNSNANAEVYAGGNTAFASGQAAMYVQGPWAITDVLLINPKAPIGTFALPCTDDPADTKVWVDLDLALWVPRTQSKDKRAAALKLVEWLFQPAQINSYNSVNNYYSTLKGAPAPTSPQVSGLNRYVAAGKTYQGTVKYMPNDIPLDNLVQEFLLSGDAHSVLATLDSDWARLQKRLEA